jgi:hypothetical protein
MGRLREAAPNRGRNRRVREIHETCRPRSGRLRIEFVTGDILEPRLRGRNRGAASEYRFFSNVQPEAAKIVRAGRLGSQRADANLLY